MPASDDIYNWEIVESILSGIVTELNDEDIQSIQDVVQNGNQKELILFGFERFHELNSNSITKRIWYLWFLSMGIHRLTSLFEDGTRLLF